MIGELLEVCAAAIIRPHREPGCRRVFLLRREEVPGQVCFTFPGGGQELGESRQSCIVREVGEELGYHGRFRLRLICSHIGEGVPGQQVNLHLFLLQLGENLDTIGPVDHDHDGFAWMSYTEVEICPRITQATRLCLRDLHHRGYF